MCYKMAPKSYTFLYLWYISASFSWYVKWLLTLISHHSRINSLNAIFLSCLIIFDLTLLSPISRMSIKRKCMAVHLLSGYYVSLTIRENSNDKDRKTCFCTTQLRCTTLVGDCSAWYITSVCQQSINISFYLLQLHELSQCRLILPSSDQGFPYNSEGIHCHKKI